MRELSYDQFGRLDRDELNVASTAVRSAPTVVTAVDYGYDNGDRLTTKETTGLADAGVNTYGYDQADRLTSWTHDPTGAPPARTTTYGWDNASNRVSVGGQTATFDERNRLLNDGTSTYSYTPRGTLSTVARGTDRQTVAFDAFDRLTTQGTANYSYDALDRVAGRNGQQFAYTGASNELASDGATRFSRGPGDELLALQSGPNKRLTVADQHGDLIAGFDPAVSLTQVADSTAYDPFGTPTATMGTKRPIGYQGDYTDPDTGQVNMTARWYNPGTGTFTSRDDMSLPTNPSSAANRYSYGAAAPTTYTDPTGHTPIPGACAPGHPNVPVPFWCHNRPDGGYGSGPGPGEGGGGSSCGGLSPDARTAGPCCGLSPDARTFGPCGNGDSGSGGLGGGFTGSGGGSFDGGGRGGGAGGAGQARPDPSIAARQANRAAARNNPMPIPHAMLTPLYGGSTTAPVSSAPDIPSRATSDYQDPVDDVNRSYQKLQDSLTVDNDTLLGTIKNTTAAPTEITPANYQPGDEHDGYCDACNWPTTDGRWPGKIDHDGRPMIDIEKMEDLGLEMTHAEWQYFSRATDEIRLSLIDLPPGTTFTPPCSDSVCGFVRGILAFGACEFLTAGAGTMACGALGGAVGEGTNSQFTGENPALAASRGAVLGAAGAALAEGIAGLLGGRGGAAKGGGSGAVGTPNTTLGSLRGLQQGNPLTEAQSAAVARMSDKELLESVLRPADGAYVAVNVGKDTILNGNHRMVELLRRAGDPNHPLITDGLRIYVVNW